MTLLLAKGDRLSDWRGLDEFVSDYRQAAITLATTRRPEALASFLGDVGEQLRELREENRKFIEQTEQMASGLADGDGQDTLRSVLTAYFDRCYDHFRRFASPPAFFEAANRFLASLTSLQVASLRRQHEGEGLPPMAVLVLGPAGRLEYTRFCRVQLALVWEGRGTAAEDQAVSEFSGNLVDWLRSCGVALDEAITPVQSAWRGDLARWRQRLENGITRGDAAELIELLRLVDQAVLVDDQGLAARFRALCSEQLHRRPAVANLVERSTALSNGLGMMGGFKLSRSGPHRGTFALLQHALVPLAACVGALCLHHDLVEDGTPRRLRELVRNGRLDVNLAERALHAWHLFSHYRLTLELSASVGQDCRDILNLDLTKLSPRQQDDLKAALETVADLQRHLYVSFGQQA